MEKAGSISRLITNLVRRGGANLLSAIRGAVWLPMRGSQGRGHLRSSQSRDIAHLGPNLACVLPEGAQSLPMMPPGASEPLSTWLGDSRGRLVNIYISMETRKNRFGGKSAISVLAFD